jgi:hypothetical protein
MTTVVVSSAIANKPLNGGNVWAVLNWVLGLERLGADVHFVEQIDPLWCRDDGGRPAAFADSVNLAYFRMVMDGFGLSERSALVCGDGHQTFGRSLHELVDLAASADLLINVSGHLAVGPLMSRFRRKLYLDLDPGYTQFWHASGDPGARLEGHDLFFTIGENLGRTGCPIPLSGLHWQPTRPPIVLDLCPVSRDGDPGRFTTVASWRGAYGRVRHGDTLYGQKAHEFRKFAGLPRRAPQVFEIALDIHSGDHNDLDLLAGHGWRVVDPRSVAVGPDDFHRYVQGSGAEFSAAQGVYVETSSGWVSDRTVHYLASGKPALVQDTGFGRTLPAGDGLVPFRTLDEAAEGAGRITRDYEAHCQAARHAAERYFDSGVVLGKLLEDVGIPP